MRETWTDYMGKTWVAPSSVRRLQFKKPSHAALRAHVFHRDGYQCVRCGAAAINVPLSYDGRYTLWTNTRVRSSGPDLLVIDHVLTLKAGGRNCIENFQTLCETCNRRKQPEDKAAAAAYRGR